MSVERVSVVPPPSIEPPDSAVRREDLVSRDPVVMLDRIPDINDMSARVYWSTCRPVPSKGRRLSPAAPLLNEERSPLWSLSAML